MSTTLSRTGGSAPKEPGNGPSLPRPGKRVWLVALAVVLGGLVLGGMVLFSWMVNETHFDRPSQAFDEFASGVESLDGVRVVEKERWVEAPTFFDPTSWISVTVDQSGLARLLEVACSANYPDAITWSIVVLTPAGSEVSLHAPAAGPGSAGFEPRCPEFGFDAERLVAELDRVAPGLAVQPAVWDNGRFAFVEVGSHIPDGFLHVLPLVEHSDELVSAAGLDANRDVEINSANLGLVLGPGESDAYTALLTALALDHDVTSFWADTGGIPVEGGPKVQIVAPLQHRDAIAESLLSSQLPVADLPVRFIEQ